MLFYTGSHIYTRGFNGRMAQYICQVGYILLRLIKTSGKQVPEIMRKYLILLNACLYAKLFHGMADIASVQGPSAPGTEQAAALYAVLPGKSLQLGCQVLWENYNSVLSLHKDFRLSSHNGFHCHIP